MVERPRRPFERPLRTVEHVAAIIGAKVPFHVYVERVRCERTFRIIQTDMFCDDLEFCFIFNHSELRNVKFPIPHHLGGTVFKEDAGRGYRRVVPSPLPVKIAEHAVIRTLVEAGHIVVASGGGGIPVMETADGYVGIEAVIDKDFAAAKLADLVNADVLLILTAVEHVYVNFGKPDEMALQETSKEQMETYIAEGQFAPGSMLPKVRAALQFAESGTNRVAIITSIDQAVAAIDGEAGTRVRIAPSLQQ